MRDDPDPERTESVAERLDTRHYGDPEGERPPHVAPPDEGDESDETPRQRVLVDPNDETRGYLMRRDGGTEVVTVEHPDDVLDSLLADIQRESENGELLITDEFGGSASRRDHSPLSPMFSTARKWSGPTGRWEWTESDESDESDRWGVFDCPDCGSPCHESWDECASCDRSLN